MNLIGKSVKYRGFGIENIVTFEELGHTIINFSIGQKSFRFPDAFNMFLKMEDNEDEQYVRGIISLQNRKIRRVVRSLLNLLKFK